MTKDRLIQDYVRDILDAMDKAERFIADMELDAFLKDEKTVYAVIRCLEIIGEAAKKILHHCGKSMQAFHGKAWLV